MDPSTVTGLARTFEPVGVQSVAGLYSEPDQMTELALFGMHGRSSLSQRRGARRWYEGADDGRALGIGDRRLQLVPELSTPLMRSLSAELV